MKFFKLFKSFDDDNDVKTSKKVKSIKVEFAPSPGNCDIEINGVYYGSAPMVIELKENIRYKVKITKPGYESWVKEILPREGMKIKPELVRKKKN